MSKEGLDLLETIALAAAFFATMFLIIVIYAVGLKLVSWAAYQVQYYAYWICVLRHGSVTPIPWEGMPNNQSLLPGIKASTPVVARTRTGGYIYLIRSDDGLVKIGQARDPKARLRELSTGSPHKLALIEQFQTPDMNLMERALHKKFQNKRKHGEWFALTAEDLDFIKNLFGVGSDEPVTIERQVAPAVSPEELTRAARNAVANAQAGRPRHPRSEPATEPKMAEE